MRKTAFDSRIRDWSSYVCSADVSALVRPVAAIVNARGHFVENGTMGAGEKFERQHADISKRVRHLQRESLGLRDLPLDQRPGRHGGGGEDAVDMDIGGRIPEPDLSIAPPNEDHRKFLFKGHESFEDGTLTADGAPCRGDRIGSARCRERGCLYV